MIEPYQRLVSLAEREHALVTAGAWEDLAAVALERANLTAALPDAAPVAAGPALIRLCTLQALTSAALADARATAGRELRALGRGRAAVRGYGAAAAGLNPAQAS